MTSIKAIRSAIVVVMAALSLVLSGNVLAVECKGKSSSACDASNSCSWVKGYTRSDGAKVSSFCRAKPGKSTGETKKATKKKKADTKKKSDTKKKTDSKKTAKKKSDSKKKDTKKTKKKSDKKDKDKKKKSSKKKDKKKS